jgi:hypothetical protein
VATILLYGADLMFLSRIDAQLSARGHVVRRVREGAEIPAAELAICDVEQVDPARAIELLRPARLLGYGSHEEPAALLRAREAGFDKVVARSAIADRLPQLVDSLISQIPPRSALR